jgi:hypothetical protein
MLMKIDSSGLLVIDDKYICEFMVKNGNESFFAACESILKSICLACEHNLNNSSQSGVLLERFEMFKTDFMDMMGSKKVDTSELMSTMKTMNEHNVLSITSKLEHIPVLSSKLDELKDKIDMTKIVESSISRSNDSVIQTLSSIKNAQDQISDKIDSFTVSRNTTRYKGEEGESGLMNILESKLHLRDGYSVQYVKSIPHSCDILVKRDGYPDIRIESKAHGRDNGENVRVAEVKKFESDLLMLNNHGIFISLYSGICGKGSFEIELLPNNKFAVYLSNNRYDSDVIVEVLKLLYRLDKFTCDNNASDSITLNTDSLMRIKTYITDFSRKIEELKSSLRNGIRILNEITLDLIEKSLTGNEEYRPQSKEFACDRCGHVCANKSGLTLHKKKCAS